MELLELKVCKESRATTDQLDLRDYKEHKETRDLKVCKEFRV